jgi:uncharacterized C2H2 Zn-finger protein
MLENGIINQPCDRSRAEVINLRQGIAKKRCPICERLFKSSKSKAVFCDYCREYSESYKFSDWMRYS